MTSGKRDVCIKNWEGGDSWGEYLLNAKNAARIFPERIETILYKCVMCVRALVIVQAQTQSQVESIFSKNQSNGKFNLKY